MSFKDYVAVQEDACSLMEMGMFFENFDGEQLDEGLNLKGMLKSIGLTTHKTGPGLIQTIGKAGKHVGQIIYYAFKSMKDDSAKEKLKELMAKKGSKEQLIEFLLQLDMVTLHLLTGPIHMIHSLTGVEIMANVKDKVADVSHRVKDALDHLAAVKKKHTGKVADKIGQIIANLKGLFPALA